MSKQIRLAILAANKERADLAIDDLWRTARSAVPSDVQLTGMAVYVANPAGSVASGDGRPDMELLALPDEGLLLRLAGRLAAMGGAPGVLGRLLQHNLLSHRVVRALAKNKELTGRFCAADMVVSADPLADWALWSLRKKTSAPLIHGPFAMANALTEMARE